ncbi:MAG: hypothetical protein WD069_14845 [Planctomycetales bacterium]
MIFAQAKWLGLQTADWVVLAIYFVLIVGIGVWSITKVKDMADFFMGGRRFGKVFMMFFAFGAGTSSDQAITVVAGTWRAGLAGIWWQFLWLWATPFYWIVAPVLRRMRALTTADFFEHRFHPSTALLYSVYGMIMAVVFISSGLYVSGKMVTALTGGELDRVADRLDISVPKRAWISEESRLGTGVLFQSISEDVVADIVADLDKGTLPEPFVPRFADAKRRLSDSAAVQVVSAGQEWKVVDDARGETFRIRQVQVEQKKQPVVIDPGTGQEETEMVDRIRVYGSGWRQVEGYELAILAMTVLFVLYGMAGGLGAAIITDFIQGILTIAFSFLLLPFVFYRISGFGALNENSGLKQGMLDLVASPKIAAILDADPITIPYVFMLSLTALAGIVVQPHIMGVCGAGKTEFEGRFGFTVGNFLKRFCTIAWTFTGLAALVWYMGSDSPLHHKELDDATLRSLPAAQQEKVSQDRKLLTDLHARIADDYNQKPKSERERLAKLDKAFADQLFGKAAFDILPTISAGLIGLLLASLLAAIMSTADAQMVVGSGLFTENIYRRYLFRGRSQNHYLQVGRVAGLFIVVLSLALQSTFSDVIDALQVVIKTPAAIGISLWFAIVWRRWNTPAVWISTFVAAAAWAVVAYLPIQLHQWGRSWGLPAAVLESVFKVNPDTGKIERMWDVWQMAAYVFAGVISGIIVSLTTPRQSKEKLDRFYRLLHTPVTPGEVVPGPCQLPENPAQPTRKLFNVESLEFQMPTLVGLGGFLLAWVGVAFIIGLTYWLAKFA